MNRIQHLARQEERTEVSTRSSKRVAEEQFIRDPSKRVAKHSNAVTRNTEQHYFSEGFHNEAAPLTSRRAGHPPKRVTFAADVTVVDEAGSSTLGAWEREKAQRQASTLKKKEAAQRAANEDITRILKRKAVEQLTRNTVVVVEPMQIPTQEPRQAPVQAPVQGHNLARDTVFAFQRGLTQLWAACLTACTNACFTVYTNIRGWAIPTYTTMNYQNPTVVAEDHVQSSEVRSDGTTTLKRQKTRSLSAPQPETTKRATALQRALAENLGIRKDVKFVRARPDFTGITDKEEQRRMMDDYYKPSCELAVPPIMISVEEFARREQVEAEKQEQLRREQREEERLVEEQWQEEYRQKLERTQAERENQWAKPANAVPPPIPQETPTAQQIPTPETAAVPESTAMPEIVVIPDTPNLATNKNRQNGDLHRRHSDPPELTRSFMLPETLPGQYPASPFGDSPSSTGFQPRISGTQPLERRGPPRRRIQPSERALKIGQHTGSPLEQRMGELLIDNTTELPTSSRGKKVRNTVAEENRKKEREKALRAAKELRLHRRAPLQSIIQRMDPYMEELVNGSMNSLRNIVPLTRGLEGTELIGKDFTTLLGQDGRNWLNDEIVNSYLEWMVKAANDDAVAKSKALGEPASTVPKFIAHNSFFFKNLKTKGPDTMDRLMKRKKAPGEKLLEVDTVFIPICEQNHWTLGVVRPVAKTIEYFDSFGGSKPLFNTLVRAWLQHQLGKSYVAKEWTEPKSTCVRQNNGYDCGVFALTNAFCVAKGYETTCYNAEDMGQQRRNIAALLLAQGWDTCKYFVWSEEVKKDETKGEKKVLETPTKRMPGAFPMSA